MPELPEIMNLAAQGRRELTGKTFREVEAKQAKCLNMPLEAFRAALVGQSIQDTQARGKWLASRLSSGWLLIGLGMGGEVLYHPRGQEIPAKLRILFAFDDDTHLSLNFWWFGYTHWVRELEEHQMVSRLGPNALDLTLDEFRALLRRRRGAIKTLLLDQGQIAGIGNVYIQDPLFKAKIHPLRPAQTLSDDEMATLWQAIRGTLQESLDLGGLAYETDLYGQKGRWGGSFFLVGYREGQPCPSCGTTVVKIKTGSTSSYICPTCQPLEKA